MGDRPANRALRAVDGVAVVALLAAIAIVAIRLEQLSSERTPPERPAESTTSPRGDFGRQPTESRPSASGCREKGIARTAGIGSCELPDGTRITAVARNARLELEEITVEYRGERTFDLIRFNRERLRPRGVFLAVRLRITNNLADPVGLESDRIALLLGDRVYAQSLFAAEASRRSLQQQAALLAGGHSATGDVVFDVPRESVAKLAGEGTVRIFQFTDDPRSGFSKPVGFLRTYV